MKIYRWYSEALNMSGVTVANHNATTEDIVAEVECYIDNTFDAANKCEDLLTSVWPIKEDDDYNELCETTIAVSY